MMFSEGKKELSVYALLVALLGGGGGFAGFNAAIAAADSRWMTHEQHTAGELKTFIRELKRDIRELEYNVREDIATDRDKWELDQLLGDLEEAEDELDK